MKKVVKFASLLLVGGTLIFTSCGKKSDDPTPSTPDPTPSGVEVCQTSNKTVYVQIDASTKSGASGFAKSYTCNASTSDFIYLDLKVKGKADKFYMKRVDEAGGVQSYSNGSAPALTQTVDGNTLTAGNDNYTFQLPDKDASNKTIDYTNQALKLKIPVTKRAGAKYDIYTFWITSSTGNFDNYNKNNTFGPVTVTLVYGTDKPLVSTSSAITLGDQDATEASYLTSSPSGITTLSGASLFISTESESEKMNSLNAVDVNFVSLSSDGSNCATKTTPYFISVGLRSSYASGCFSNTQGTNTTKYAKVTLPSGKTFDDLTADDVNSIVYSASPSASKIMVENNSFYAYVTQDGRQGVLSTSGLTASPKATVMVKAKVAVQ